VGATHLTGALAVFTELGSSLWRAKTLTLLSDVHSVAGNTKQAYDELDQATRLLAEIDSREAFDWRAQLESAKSALLADPTVGVDS
jgi:hypothetical protein